MDTEESTSFIFNEENFKDPKLPHGLTVLDVVAEPATDDSLKGYGYIVRNPDEFTTDVGGFEIKKWPQPGWRALDPNTGDEAGTTEGNFEVHWKGDFYYGKNLAVNTTNNTYLDGLGAVPEAASHTDSTDATSATDQHIYLWMSDYHPDGGQLFWPLQPIPFVVCLGLNTYGDDIQPKFMKAFKVPAGQGVYIHPGTWHNGVYVAKEYSPSTFLTRQGKVHARVSCSWANEYKCLLKVPLSTRAGTAGGAHEG